MRALDIIQDAYERCNRLSPGEVLNNDDASFALRKLNLLVDELSAQNLFLFQHTLTSGVASGNITLGAGAWAALGPGTEVVSATANNLAITKMTMQQFNELYQPTATGLPTVWAQDGMNTVYLWPVPTGQTIKLDTRQSVSSFADVTTIYSAPDGWQAALGAGLAVRIASTILGRLPPELVRAETKCMGAVSRYEPAIVNVDGYNKTRAYFPPRLF